MNKWHRIRQILLVTLAGGMLLQTTATSCQDLLAPLIANVVSSLVLNALLGGLGT